MFSTIWYLAGVAGMWKMFEKAGEDGWKAIIPFYNQYILCDKVMKNPWYWLRLMVVIIPFIGWVAYFYFKYQIGKATARAYGQPDSYAWGYTFIDPVFYCVTGFGQYDYYGPFGSGDTRTGEARQAKTVDFDVVKNEPAAEPVVAMPAEEPVVEPIVEAAEPVVEAAEPVVEAAEPVVEAASEFEMKPTEEPAKESSGEVEFDFDQSGE